MDPNNPDNQNINNVPQPAPEPVVEPAPAPIAEQPAPAPVEAPAPAPVDPATPVAPVTPVSPIAQPAAAPAKKGLSKGLIIAICGGVAAIAAFLVVYFVFLAKPTLEKYCNEHKDYCDEMLEDLEYAAGNMDDASASIKGNDIVLKATLGSEYASLKDTLLENLNKSGDSSDASFKIGIAQLEKETEVSGIRINMEVYIGSEMVWSRIVSGD